MTERYFLSTVRKLARENGIDFFAATRNDADWSFEREQSPKLRELADACRQLTDKED